MVQFSFVLWDRATNTETQIIMLCSCQNVRPLNIPGTQNLSLSLARHIHLPTHPHTRAHTHTYAHTHTHTHTHFSVLVDRDLTMTGTCNPRRQSCWHCPHSNSRTTYQPKGQTVYRRHKAVSLFPPTEHNVIEKSRLCLRGSETHIVWSQTTKLHVVMPRK
jgi:hypothetical protein